MSSRDDSTSDPGLGATGQRVVRGRTQDEAARQLSALEYRNLELLQKARDHKH